jgi:uncharacterized protein
MKPLFAVRSFAFLLSLSLLFSISATCQAATPSDASIRTLFAEMKAESITDGMYAQFEPMMRQAITQATAGKEPTPQQQKLVELYPKRMGELMRTELSWAKMEPVQLKIYRESFDQSEIDGLIEFYRSPAGRSYTSKMPAVTQRTMVEMQAFMLQVMPKLQAAMLEMIRDIQAAK